MRNVSNKFVPKIKKRISDTNLFFKPCRLPYNAEWRSRAGRKTDDNMAHAHCIMLHQSTNTHPHYTLFIAYCYISLQTHSHYELLTACCYLSLQTHTHAMHCSLHAVTSVYKHTLTPCTAHCMLLPQSTNTHSYYALLTACCYLNLQTHTHTMYCSLHAVTSVYKYTLTLCTAHWMLLPHSTNTHSPYALLTACCYLSLQIHTHTMHYSLHAVTSVYKHTPTLCTTLSMLLPHSTKNTLTLCNAHCMLLPHYTNTHSHYALLTACCYLSLQTHTHTMHCSLHAVTSVYKHTPTQCTTHLKCK